MAKTRLVYGEDIQVGMWMQVEKAPEPPDPALGAMLLMQGRPKTTTVYWYISEVRTYGEVVSCILIDDDGEQQPFGCPCYGLIRVLAEPPSLPDDLTVADFEKET